MGSRGEGDLTPPIGESAVVVAVASPENSQVPGGPAQPRPFQAASTKALPPVAGRDCPPGLALQRVGSRDVPEPASVIRSLGIRNGGSESESAGVRECEGPCACVQCGCARRGVSGCPYACVRTSIQGSVVGVSTCVPVPL